MLEAREAGEGYLATAWLYPLTGYCICYSGVK